MIQFDAWSKSRLAACMLALVGTLGAGTALGQDVVPPPSPVIAVVDVQVVLRQAAAAASIRQQIDDYSVEFQGKIDEEKMKLEAESRELQEQRTLLSAEAFAQRRQNLQRDQGDLQEYVKTVRNVLSEAMKQARQTMEAALIEEINAMAEEHGVNLILNRRQALYASAALDLTDVALRRLDARLSEVPIDISTVEKPKTAP